VKTTGLTLDSAYSSNASFIAANAPATPAITAPTSGSPPTRPDPAIVFTESSAFSERRIRVVTGGSQVYDSDWISGSGLSFPTPYQFATGISYTLYLSVRNQYGLASAETSQTFTPSFVGPAVPGISVDADNNGGFIKISVTNASGDYNDIFRWKTEAGEATKIRVAKNVPINSAFEDHNTASGQSYTYRARAYFAATLKFSDSTTTPSASLTLSQGFLHIVRRD